jgi:hypothetical protein
VFCFINWIKAATIGIKNIGYTSHVYADIYILFNKKYGILFQILGKFKFFFISINALAILSPISHMSVTPDHKIVSRYILEYLKYCQHIHRL